MVSVIGIVVSAVVSFCVARFVRPWSKVVVLLKPQMEDGTKKGKGREACFILSISNGCFSRGVTSYNVCPDLMPALLFRGFRVRSVMTMNNDLAKFYIPVVPVSADSSKLILNIKWIRSNTEAKFLIKGVLDAGISIKEVVVDFSLVYSMG